MHGLELGQRAHDLVALGLELAEAFGADVTEFVVCFDALVPALEALAEFVAAGRRRSRRARENL